MQILGEYFFVRWFDVAMVVNVRFRRVSAARRSETSAPIGRTLGERFVDGLITDLF